jgi:hypothetical protein
MVLMYVDVCCVCWRRDIQPEVPNFNPVTLSRGLSGSFPGCFQKIDSWMEDKCISIEGGKVIAYIVKVHKLAVK